MSAKKKYLVELNWYGEVHKIYTSSYSKAGALSNSFYQLAKKVDYYRPFVIQHFLGNKDNFKVTEREDQ